MIGEKSSGVRQVSSRKWKKSSRHSKTTDVNPLTKVSSSLLVSPATEPAIIEFFHSIQVATAHLLTNQQCRCVSVQTTEGLINLKPYSGWGEILLSYDSRTRLLSSAQTNGYILAFLLELCSLLEPGISIQEWERIWFNLSRAFTNQPELHSHLIAELLKVWQQPACQLIRPATPQNPLPSSEQHQPFEFLESLDDLTEEEHKKYRDESKKTSLN